MGVTHSRRTAAICCAPLATGQPARTPEPLAPTTDASEKRLTPQSHPRGYVAHAADAAAFVVGPLRHVTATSDSLLAVSAFESKQNVARGSPVELPSAPALSQRTPVQTEDETQPPPRRSIAAPAATIESGQQPHSGWCAPSPLDAPSSPPAPLQIHQWLSSPRVVSPVESKVALVAFGMTTIAREKHLDEMKQPLQPLQPTMKPAKGTDVTATGSEKQLPSQSTMESEKIPASSTAIASADSQKELIAALDAARAEATRRKGGAASPTLHEKLHGVDEAITSAAYPKLHAEGEKPATVKKQEQHSEQSLPLYVYASPGQPVRARQLAKHGHPIEAETEERSEGSVTRTVEHEAEVSAPENLTSAHRTAHLAWSKVRPHLQELASRGLTAVRQYSSHAKEASAAIMSHETTREVADSMAQHAQSFVEHERQTIYCAIAQFRSLPLVTRVWLVTNIALLHFLVPLTFLGLPEAWTVLTWTMAGLVLTQLLMAYTDHPLPVALRLGDLARVPMLLSLMLTPGTESIVLSSPGWRHVVPRVRYPSDMFIFLLWLRLVTAINFTLLTFHLVNFLDEAKVNSSATIARGVHMRDANASPSQPMEAQHEAKLGGETSTLATELTHPLQAASRESHKPARLSLSIDSKDQ